MKRDSVIALSIYLATGAGLLIYNLTHLPVNDGVWEYQACLQNIEYGWEYRRTLVNSCLVTTWLPAMMNKYMGLDAMVSFRIIPALFYPLMPAFTYLIAKRYLVMRYALIAVLVVVFNSHILFFPDIGRVGVAFGFLSGLVWALLEKRLILAILFTVMLVFSHYATALIGTGLVISCLLFYGIWKKKLLRKYLVVLGVLVLTIGVWHFWIASYSGFIMLTHGFQHDLPDITGDTTPVPYSGFDAEIWLDVETREVAVQDALGVGFRDMTWPKRIEIMANWFVVGMVTLGLYALIRKKRIDPEFKIMAASLWGLIVFTVTVPWLSTYYGGMRVYFTSLMVLAPCFVMGVEWIAKKAAIKPLVACILILSLYATSTSGLIYKPFGLVKTFPVHIEIIKEVD